MCVAQTSKDRVMACALMGIGYHQGLLLRPQSAGLFEIVRGTNLNWR